jgi:hypothetical protein
MDDMNAAGQHAREAEHLIRAHGADAGRLTGRLLSPGQLSWLHFDTHAALDIAQAGPPDGHVHAALPDPGYRFTASHEHCGLPQTEMDPGRSPGEDLTGRWPSAALAIARGLIEENGDDPGRVLAQYRAELKHLADAVAASWLAGNGFPAPPSRPGTMPPRIAAPGQQVPRRARRR